MTQTPQPNKDWLEKFLKEKGYDYYDSYLEDSTPEKPKYIRCWRIGDGNNGLVSEELILEILTQSPRTRPEEERAEILEEIEKLSAVESLDPNKRTKCCDYHQALFDIKDFIHSRQKDL